MPLGFSILAAFPHKLENGHSAATVKQVKLYQRLVHFKGFACGSDGKESARNAKDQVRSLCWEDPLEKEMATHSSILEWRIPWTEEPVHGVANSWTQLRD